MTIHWRGFTLSCITMSHINPCCSHHHRIVALLLNLIQQFDKSNLLSCARLAISADNSSMLPNRAVYATRSYLVDLHVYRTRRPASHNNQPHLWTQWRLPVGVERRIPTISEMGSHFSCQEIIVYASIRIPPAPTDCKERRRDYGGWGSPSQFTWGGGR